MNAMSLPSVPDEVEASTLPQIIELYLTSKLSSGEIMPRTEHNYRNHLSAWIAFWDTQEHVHHGRLSPAILRKANVWMLNDYQGVLGRRQISHNGIVHTWTRLKQVFNWAFAAGCTGGINLATWCPSLTPEAPDTHFTTLAELQKMIATVNGPQRLRDSAIVAFLAATGARKYEAAWALTEDITWLTPVTDLQLGSDHRGWVWLSKTKGDRTGKLGKGRVVAFDCKTGLLLKAYLRSCGRTEGPIFDLTDTGIGQLIDKWATAAGCGDVSCHAFRRMFADNWDATYGDTHYAALKKIMGHSFSNDVTKTHYIRGNKARTARQILSVYVSPVDQLSIDWAKYPVHIPEEGKALS